MNHLVLTSTSVLDAGYIGLVESWGSEERIIEAARMSVDKGFEGWGPRCKRCKRPLELVHNQHVCLDEKCEEAGAEPGDEKLLDYLYGNRHHTPFEMAGMIFEIKAPIFVFREWHRHRTQSYNEMSARYTPLPDENYIPSVDRLLRRGPGFESTSKQAMTVKGSDDLTEEAAQQYIENLRELYNRDERFYQGALKMGVPKELARIHLPVGRYSRMRASANLRNWMQFLSLRMAKDAQWEIRQYAEAACSILKGSFPRTIGLFKKGSGLNG